jgi:polyisoprenoid-binding protein YceI
MRMSARWKLLLAGATALLALGGCRLPPHGAAPPPALQPPGVAPHLGTPYEVVAADSLLTILVYRGGALASVGHNHVIASHDLRGTLYVTPDPMRSSFELHVPVATLTVDEEALRAQQASADFPPDVPESAKEGTRRNMLGEALLDAAESPEILLQAVRLEQSAAPDPRTVMVRLQSTVRGQQRIFAVPVSYQIGEGAVMVSGTFPLRQSDLGLTPFSAMLGALQVQDEMRISLRIVARAAARNGALIRHPPNPASAGRAT